jgi:pimeloyl-ACP methyl ester carboxylesterase
MPYSTNPVDGVRSYFEDSGGADPPVLFYAGFADPLEVAKSSRLAGALGAEFRLIFADHRGQGGSDKPREASAYALARRVADAVAVLEAPRGRWPLPLPPGAKFVSLAGHSHISALLRRAGDAPTAHGRASLPDGALDRPRAAKLGIVQAV